MELDLNKKDTIPAINIEAVKNQEKEYKLIGRARCKPGQTLFSFNKVTGELKPATVTSECYISKFGTPAYKKKTNVEQNCFYFFALNEKNARKKIQR